MISRGAVTRRGAAAGVTTACGALAALVVLGGCGPVVTGTAQSSTVTSTTSGPVRHVVIVADESLDGTSCGGRGDANWSAALDRSLQGLPVRVTVDAAQGAGYVATGAGRTTLGGLAAGAVSGDAGLVVVIGGGRDEATRFEVDGAADALVADARAAAPVASVLVVGPLSSTGSADPELALIDSTLSRVASRNGAQYLSALGWSAGAARLQCPGSADLTDAGHDELGSEVAGAIRAILD